MRLLTTLIVKLIVVALPSVVAAQSQSIDSPVNVTGKWFGDYSIDSGPSGRLEAQLTQVGDQVSGSLFARDFFLEGSNSVLGTLSGTIDETNRGSFDVDFQFPSGRVVTFHTTDAPFLDAFGAFASGRFSFPGTNPEGGTWRLRRVVGVSAMICLPIFLGTPSCAPEIVPGPGRVEREDVFVRSFDPREPDMTISSVAHAQIDFRSIGALASQVTSFGRPFIANLTEPVVAIRFRTFAEVRFADALNLASRTGGLPLQAVIWITFEIEGIHDGEFSSYVGPSGVSLVSNLGPSLFVNGERQTITIENLENFSVPFVYRGSATFSAQIDPNQLFFWDVRMNVDAGHNLQGSGTFVPPRFFAPPAFAPTIMYDASTVEDFLSTAVVTNILVTDLNGNPITGLTLSADSGTSYPLDPENALAFSFTGFFNPVDNPPILNAVKAGQAVPVKFSLDGDQGLAILTATYPKSQTIPCEPGALLDDLEETVTAGGSALSYEATADMYNYVWKTSKGWRGTCRQFVMQLIDGSVHRANFMFK
ncbi:MAG: PxKF domain-containing protein [bacterium]